MAMRDARRWVVWDAWRLPVDGSPTTPAIAEGMIVVGTSLGKLVAFGTGAPGS
jgi:hypothetical protein